MEKSDNINTKMRFLFWEEYEPSAKTLREINQANNQLELFESEGAKA